MKSQHTALLFSTYLLFLLTSCGSLMEPEFRSIENVRLTRLGAKESHLALELEYFNPNKSQLKLKEAEGDAWIDGNPLGHFIIDTMVTIPPVSVFRLPVKLQLEMSQVFRNSITTFLYPEVTIRVEGKAKIGKGGFYIRYPLRYEGKQDFGKLF